MRAPDLVLAHSFAFEEDVSMLRADPLRPVVLANLGYDAIQVLDLHAMTTRRLDLAPLARDFAIYSWAVDVAGRISVLAGSDPLEFVIGLDHARWQLARLPWSGAIPPLANLCWSEPRTTLLDASGTLWVLDQGRMVQASPQLQDLKPYADVANVARRYAILSRQPQSGRLCILDGERCEIGLWNPEDCSSVMQAAQGNEIAAAEFCEGLIVAYLDRLEYLREGQRAIVLRPAAGEELFALALVHDGETPLLAVARGQRKSGARNFVDVYALRSG